MRPTLIFLVVLLIGPILHAQDNNLTPLDVAKIKGVSWFDVSSDGKNAIYGLVNPADPLVENALPTVQMYLLNIETGESTALVTDKTASSGFFRPNSQTITFLAKDDNSGTNALYEIPIAGGEATVLFTYDRSIKSYHWAHNGEKLIFSSADERQKSEAPYEPEIFEENLVQTRAYLYHTSTKQIEKVPLEGSIYWFKWSPDDKKIAISSAPTPLVDDFYVKQQVSVIDAHTLQQTGKIDHQAKLGTFTWSPDGAKMVMIAGASINDPIEGRLFIAEAKGGKPLQLLPDFEGMFDAVQWTDKNNIHVLASVGTQSKLLTINPANEKIKVVSASEEGDPVWSDFVVAENSVIFTASRYNHPSELFAMTAGDLRRLTNSNPWLDQKSFGKQQVIRYPASDGLEIEGILITPKQTQDGLKIPLITVVHGGPESHFNNSWLTGYSTIGHVGAANGYAVFYPNYRGSTGRGIEYTMSSQGDQGGKEFDDIVDGVDYLVQSGLVDKDRVGVTGGSYGGFATAMLATKYSNKFAAGVMFVGISDHISKWGTSDIPEEMYNVHARTRIWDDYQYWLKRSPIYYVDQAKTPLLIMHGKDDTRVNPGQSMELYRHIKTRTDTPVRLVLYPQEGHGNRRSTARLDYNLRALRWFNYYLKDSKSELDTQIELKY